MRMLLLCPVVLAAVMGAGHAPLQNQAKDTAQAVAGRGPVILITDGDESCKGDRVKAAAELKTVR